MDLTRASFLYGGGGAAALSALGAPALAQSTIQFPFANGTRPLAAFPQKRRLIVLTPRPPQLETPFEIFDRSVITPNDAFFVRWHLANIPTRVDGARHRIRVHGAVSRQLSLSLTDLRRHPPIEIVAVNQCSGNSRALSSPRVAGGQWNNGAMGNARWKGVRLREILDHAGLTAAAKQVRFNGLDSGVIPQTPDFLKSLDVDVARRDDVIVAYEMNGAPLPLLNGYPVRLVVPGWYSTYWVKMLDEIEVLDHVDDNFWMKTAYRIPDTPNNSVSPSDKGFPTIPINRMKVRSFITNVTDGGRLHAGPQTIRGIAFDGGSGIKTVELSTDGGATWTIANLGRDLGNYSFRQWQATFAPQAGSTYTLACRATANDGSQQTSTPTWNPAGYLRNIIEKYKVSVA